MFRGIKVENGQSGNQNIKLTTGVFSQISTTNKSIFMLFLC